MSDETAVPTTQLDDRYDDIRREVSERVRRMESRSGDPEVLLVILRLDQFESRIAGIHNTHNGHYRTLNSSVHDINEEIVDLVGKKGNGRVGVLEEKVRKLEEGQEKNRTAIYRLVAIVMGSMGGGVGLAKLLFF